MTKEREPVDDLIDAHVWLRRVFRNGRGNIMRKIVVYKFQVYSIMNDELKTSRRYGPRDAVQTIAGGMAWPLSTRGQRAENNDAKLIEPI